MSLYSQTIGRGNDLVFIHGWGMHSSIWEDIAQEFAKHWRVTLIDLPGHGRSTYDPEKSGLRAISDQVVENTPRGATLLGWSLGGMVAMRCAIDHPQHVSKLVLIASTPQFVKSDDWAGGLDTETLDGFARDLKNDYRTTLVRFLSLQARGSDKAREDIRRLRERVFQYGDPNVNALRNGLNILCHTDLRPELTAISCPTLIIMGQRDALIPVSTGAAMRDTIKHADLHIINGAGHAPFLSHSLEFNKLLVDFLHD